MYVSPRSWLRWWENVLKVDKHLVQIRLELGEYGFLDSNQTGIEYLEKYGISNRIEFLLFSLKNEFSLCAKQKFDKYMHFWC